MACTAFTTSAHKSEGRKNQCTFKTDSDAFEKNCEKKLRNLNGALIDAKKRLNGAGVKNFKFEVSGHTDSSGSGAPRMV